MSLDNKFDSQDSVIGETVNLGVGEGPSVRDLVALVGQLLGKELPVETDQRRIRPANSEMMRLISDNSKARKLMGWQPQVSLKDGLEQTIHFVQ